MKNVISVEHRDGIAIVSIENPPVNATSQAVRSALADAVAATNAEDSVRAVVLHCVGRTFIAGADIKEFGKPPQEPHLPDVIRSIEQATKPWVAAIHGNALGGGLEVALGCHYRVADSAAKLGFPEVNLGLIPGAGGTARLPRLVAMEEALDLIVGGKPCTATHALSIGLVDHLAEPDTDSSSALDENICKAAHRFAKTIQDHDRPVALSEATVVMPLSTSESAAALQRISAKSRGQHSPIAAANAVINGVMLTSIDALAAERKTFLELQADTQSKALRYIFFAERSATKIPELKSVAARTCASLGVIGGGTMGAGIAAAALLSGLPVTLIERDTDALLNGENNLKHILESSVKRRIITPARRDQLVASLTLSTDYQSLADADFIIEAVFEDMDVKKAVFKQLDTVTKPSAILASNTSYLDVNELAASTDDPRRVIGLHFFSPAHIMKLVEVIRTDFAAPDVVQTALTLALKLRKLPVPAGVCDGFIGNRIMSAYRRAGEYLIEDGALPFEVDAVMKDFGFAMGLFEMQDLAGLDIGYAMRQRRQSTRDPSERYVDIPDRIVEMDRLGRKTGAGYYTYSDGKTPVRDPVIEELIEAESARKAIKRTPFTPESIMDTLLSTMHQEGEAILEEGIADSAEAIDVVMVNGYGFPRWHAGPMYYWANR